MKVFPLFSLLLAGTAFAQSEIPPTPPTDESTPYLSARILRYRFESAGAELSGLSASGDRLRKATWLTVVDGATAHPTLYRLEHQSEAIRAAALADLSTFSGYSSYIDSLARSTLAQDKKFQNFDLEGVAQCGESRVYLANERARDVLEVDLTLKSIRALPIPFLEQAGMMEGGMNAGFEGIAVDCQKQKLYVSKERLPRRLYVVDLKTFQVQSSFDFPVSARYQLTFDRYNSSKPALKLNKDIADLAFRNGYLYALERNSYEIAKIDPRTQQVVARLSFGDLILKRGGAGVSVQRLYENGEPFGLAEGMLIGRDRIVLAFDNNEKPLTAEASTELGVSGNAPLVLELARPRGF